MLLECGVGLSMDTTGASLTLCDVRALGNRNRYFVDVSQWEQTLNGAESAALIPVICRVFYSYSVNVGLSGVTVSEVGVGDPTTTVSRQLLAFDFDKRHNREHTRSCMIFRKQSIRGHSVMDGVYFCLFCTCWMILPVCVKTFVR